MKSFLNAMVLGLLSLFVFCPSIVTAQGFGGPQAAPLRFGGVVTAVDTTLNLITVKGRGENAESTTIKFNNDTQYSKQVLVPVTTLKVGDIISIASATPFQPTDTTITATRITVLPELPAAPPTAAGGNFGIAGGFGGRRGGGRPVVGTVATTTPTLTITNQVGATITVTTDANTPVEVTQPALATDVAVGSNVQISGKTDAAATLIATTVAIQAARAPRVVGGANL